MRAILAFSDAETITFTVVGFFLALALLTFARIILRKGMPPYRRVRFGVFVERDDDPNRDKEER